MARGYKVELLVDATAVTGSIAKIYACGDDATDTNGDVTVLCTVDNVTFGDYIEGATAAQQTTAIRSNISTNFILANGTYLEGPIYAFKSADTTGRFLIYYNI
jgi:hypothetical protein